MPLSAAFLLLPALPIALVFAGYGLTTRLPTLSPAERLAVATLAGLGVLLLNLSVVNFFAPLDAARAWLCLWPVALPFARPVLLARLRDDVGAVLRTRKGVLAAGLGTASLLLLVWPELTQPRLVFHDSTNSHDGYFWITGAKHLQAHSYMEVSPIDLDRPWANSTPALSGWRPAWGRAGAEGLLAMCASLLALDPLHVYLPATAALLACWFAAVYLVVRTFWLSRLTPAGVAALFALPSLFVFYRANANFPNLVGALTGAAALVATARSLDAGASHRWPWLVLLALSVHGTFSAYPEIAPFIALPAGLLLVRALRPTPTRVLPPLLALLAGLAIHPAATLRAFHGFAQAFVLARADAIWVNAFDRIRWPQYPPSLATLSLPTAKFLGPPLCAVASVLLIAAAIAALRRAPDRFAAAATLSGCAALIVYTLLTDFNYGWQKAIQFSGVFVAAILPVAAIELAAPARSPARLRRAINLTLAGAVALLFAMAMVFHFLETEKWTGRRFISRDWIELQAFAAESLHDAEVRVEPATFPMSFFHGMWAAYFLRDARLVFSPRGNLNGGYLHPTVVTGPPLASDGTAAVLVGRAWADTFDANSTRRFAGDTFALISRSNQIVSLTGFLPDEGVPATLSPGAVIELRPHSRSELHVALARETPANSSAVEWRATGGTTIATARSTAGPWNLVVPLTAGQLHRIEFTASAVDPSALMPRYKIAALRVVTVP